MLISLTPHTLFPSWQIRAFICIWVPLVDKERSPRTAEKLRDTVCYRTTQFASDGVSVPLFCLLKPDHTTDQHRLSCCGDRSQTSAPHALKDGSGPLVSYVPGYSTLSPHFWDGAALLSSCTDWETALQSSWTQVNLGAPLPSSYRPMLAQVKPAGQGSEPSPLFSTSAATSAKLCPVSGSQTQCRHWQTAASPTDGHKGGHGLEHTL